MTIVTDDAFNETLLNEIEYQLIVPIESASGIINVVHFRLRKPLDKEQYEPVIKELYKNNDKIFAALKIFFGGRVPSEAK